MQRLPYTIDEANTLCKKLQHLIGHAFDAADPDAGPIECVAVTPFDHINKKKFFLFYMLVGDANMALKEEYKGFLFDVCVISRSICDSNDIRHYDIDTWLSKNNLQLGTLMQPNPISSDVPQDRDITLN